MVPFFGRDFVTEQLAHIRKAIADSRGQNQSRSDKPTHVYLGDLGQFCEEVCKSWKASEEIPHFAIRHQSEEETWRYLQDALEVHYWKHMLYLFSRWQQQTKAWSGEAVSRVLQSVEHILRHQIRHLKALSDKHGVDIKPITDGIEARIVVLESFSSGRTLQCGEEYDCNCFSHGLRKVEDDHLTQQLDGDGNRSTVRPTIWHLSLSGVLTYLAGNGNPDRLSIDLSNHCYDSWLQRIFPLDEGQSIWKHQRCRLLVPHTKQHHGCPGKSCHGYTSAAAILVFPSL